MSRSKSLSNRAKELKQKEQILLSDLNMNGTKAKKIALWSLGSGLVVLAGYSIYRAFSTPPEKPEKKKSKKLIPKDSHIVDWVVENLAPTFGKWLLKQLKD